MMLLLYVDNVDDNDIFSRVYVYVHIYIVLALIDVDTDVCH
jgi:hypothetical protein